MDIERKQREIDHWIASCERSKPLLEGYTRRVLCYDNSQESYIELSQMLASRLIEPLLKEKSEEKVKFGAAFIGMGYSLAAIYSNGKTIPITHQIKYVDSPLLSYDVSSILNINAESIRDEYFADEDEEESNENINEEIKTIETAELIKWLINPRGNDEVIIDVLKRICYPVVREIYSKLPGRGKKEIAIYFPFVSSDVGDPNWEVVFEDLHLDNTTLVIMNYASLVDIKDNERIYLMNWHEWMHNKTLVISGIQKAENGIPVPIGSAAVIEEYSLRLRERKTYRVKNVKKFRVNLVGRKPEGTFEPIKTTTLEPEYDFFIKPTFAISDGARSYMGSHTASFISDFFVKKPYEGETTSFEDDVRSVFGKGALMLSTACAKLKKERNLANISLGDMVAFGMVLENKKLFTKTTLKNAEGMVELGNDNKLFDAVDFNKILSLPSNYASFVWTNKTKKYSNDDYAKMKSEDLKKKGIIEQIQLIVEFFDNADTDAIAEELIFINGNSNMPTALFTAKMFMAMCESNLFNVVKKSEDVEDFDESTVSEDEITLPEIVTTPKTKKPSTDIRNFSIFKKRLADEALDTPIEELDLTVRSYNCLKRARIHTVRDLVGMTRSELYKVRNLGNTQLIEIEEKIAKLGLKFKKEDESRTQTVYRENKSVGTTIGDILRKQGIDVSMFGADDKK